MVELCANTCIFSDAFAVCPHMASVIPVCNIVVYLNIYTASWKILFRDVLFIDSLYLTSIYIFILFFLFFFLFFKKKFCNSYCVCIRPVCVKKEYAFARGRQ